MVHLEKINGENIWDILKLRVSESQKNFVASNEISILEAYAAIASNGYAFPFGIFDGDAPVGFVMVGYDKDDCWKDAPAIAEGNYNLWRLMIDENYQNAVRLFWICRDRRKGRRRANCRFKTLRQFLM